MRNRTDADSNAFFLFTKIAKSQYNAATENRCCDKFLFTVHPVFGVFYNIRIPLLDEAQGDDDNQNTPFFTRSICFRRKFHPKPKLKAFTPLSVGAIDGFLVARPPGVVLLYCEAFVACAPECDSLHHSQLRCVYMRVRGAQTWWC